MTMLNKICRADHETYEKERVEAADDVVTCALNKMCGADHKHREHTKSKEIKQQTMLEHLHLNLNL